MEIQMPSLVWIGSICGIFFFFPLRAAAVLSLCGIKGSINKEQKSSAVRLGQWLLGVVPANRETWLFVLLIMESWDTSSGAQGTQKLSSLPPSSLQIFLLLELHSFSQGVLFLSFNLP